MVEMSGLFSQESETGFATPEAVNVTVEVTWEGSGLLWAAPTTDFWALDLQAGGHWRHPKKFRRFAVDMGYPNPETLFKSFKDDPRPIYRKGYMPPVTLWDHLLEDYVDYRVCTPRPTKP